MPPKEVLTFALSQEELLVVLAYLQATSLLGFDIEVFQGLGDTEREMVFSVAERALMARGFLRPGADGRLQLEPAIFATVGACAMPDETIVVTRNPAGALQEKYFFHCSRRMVVLHTVPVSAIHQFIAFEEKSAILRAILSILALSDRPPLSCSATVLEQESLLSARDAAEKGAHSARAFLLQAGLEENTAEELAQSLASLSASTTLVRVAQDEAAGFTLLQAKNGDWLLSPEDPESEKPKVSVVPVSSEEIRERVRSLLGV